MGTEQLMWQSGDLVTWTCNTHFEPRIRTDIYIHICSHYDWPLAWLHWKRHCYHNWFWNVFIRALDRTPVQLSGVSSVARRLRSAFQKLFIFHHVLPPKKWVLWIFLLWVKDGRSVKLITDIYLIYLTVMSRAAWYKWWPAGHIQPEITCN
jgi:hypothetical protein